MSEAVEAVHHITNMLPFKIALIGTLGIGAQWLAWRLRHILDDGARGNRDGVTKFLFSP